MAYKVLYKTSVRKDLKRIDKKEVVKILNVSEGKLSESPKAGKRLTGEFTGLYSYRVGDFRVVYTLLGESILILRISHRKDVYR